MLLTFALLRQGMWTNTFGDPVSTPLDTWNNIDFMPVRGKETIVMDICAKVMDRNQSTCTALNQPAMKAKKKKQLFQKGKIMNESDFFHTVYQGNFEMTWLSCGYKVNCEN